MSNIESNITDPRGKGSPPPDLVPVIDDPSTDPAGSDIREPLDEITPIEPDPEEGGRPNPVIRRD